MRKATIPPPPPPPLPKDHEWEAGTYYDMKNDRGKPRLDLLPPEWLMALTATLMVGADKYGPNTWRHVPDARDRYYAAALRHLLAWRDGQAISDDGLPSLAQAAINCLFLLSLDKAE